MTTATPELEYSLGSNQHWLLVEALRRFECFAVRRDNRKWTLKDLQAAWTGLGTWTDYKPAFDGGYMRGAPPRRAMGWWTLTEKGARIVLAWHEAGYGCDDGYEVKNLPPFTSEALQRQIDDGTTPASATSQPPPTGD